MAYRRGDGGRNFFNRQPNNPPVLNPWQGGMTPGGGGGGGGGQLNAQNILGQLSEPQAQLALAITSLLSQPQQQAQQQNQNPPSLLSLDFSPRGGFNSNAGFRNSNFNQRNLQNRGRPDFRRHDNHNKNNFRDRGGDIGNRRPDINRRNPANLNRKQNEQRSRSRDKSKDSAPAAKGAESYPKKSSSQQSDKPIDKEEASSNADADTIEIKEEPARTDTEESFTEKRDWKDEKKPTDAVKTEQPNEGGEGEDKDKDGKPKRNKDGNYAGIPSSYLICTMCNKRMWDGDSFEKHLRGRAHQQIVDSIEISYKLKCNMMRESMRLEEEKKNIEMNRMKRSGKVYKQQQMYHCNMCDLEFYGNLTAHRRTAGHQRLKAFLHPKCRVCNKEFSNRMDWDAHNVTPEHLLNKYKVALKEGKTDIPIEKADEPGAGEVDVVKNENDLFEDCEDPEPENAILDLADNLTNIPSRLPIYKPRRLIGESCVKSVTGFQCDLCQCFLISEDERLRHLKSQRHYNAFITELNKRVITEIKNKKKRAGEENSEDDGNWKRRRVNEENKGEGDEANEENKNSDLYDPSEPSEEPEPMDDNEQENGEKSKDKIKLGDDDEVWQEVDNLIENAKQDETDNSSDVAIVEEEKSDPVEVDTSTEKEVSEKSESENTPAGGRMTRRNVLRNGPGPKSKTRGRKSQ